jgi:hypothetical protein
MSGSKRFFFEKKNQKTFSVGAAHGCRRTRDVVGAVAKVFASFFQKEAISFTYPS